MTTHQIIITPSCDRDGYLRHNSRGPQYDVTYEGQTIVTGSTQPCLDACRVLKAMGIIGELELWDNVFPYCRLKTDIDRAAGLTIREGDRLPRFVRFESYAPRNFPQAFSGARSIPVAQTQNGPSGKKAAKGIAGAP